MRAMAGNDDERRKQLGSAPTTPAPPDHDVLAAGSTLDMPASEQGGNELGAGAQLGRFVLKRRLGRGGMGEVFAGEDVQLGRPVAIKVVRGDTDHPAYHARLMREAQALARLEHPNIVRVYEVNSDHGRLFVAMELVDGTTLTQWLQQPRSWQDIVAMFEQIGVGLVAVHRAGIVHRDFKPDNVLIDRDGKARVADFGLARTTREDASPMGQPLTRTGAMMGTPGYMAPEQQFGAEVDARADQYSFCVALREALGGRPLDEARWESVPKSVRDAIGRGLAYDPDERFPTMEATLAALHGAASGRDPRWLVALVVLVVLGAVAGIVAYVSSRAPAQQVAQQAPRVADAAPVDVPFVRDDVIAHDSGSNALAQGSATTDVVPRDAGVPRVVHVARDAGVHDAPVRVAEAPGDAALPTLRPGAPIVADGPTTKHWPVAQPSDPGHLAVVRAAIRDLGYDGFELGKVADLAREAKAEAASDDRVTAGIALVKLGLVARRTGDCTAAASQFDAADKQLKPQDPDDVQTWRARAALSRALCEIGAGKSDLAHSTINYAWVHGSGNTRDEIALAMGFIAYELGDKNLAYAQLLTAERKPSPRVQAALKAWLDGLGLGLHTP
jgi:serine/threonine-protein kinase